MRDLTALLWESPWIFDHWDQYLSPRLFDQGGYFLIGLNWTLVPLLCLAILYYVWNPVYPRLYHWFLVLGTGMVLVAASTALVLYLELADFLQDPDTYPQTDLFIWKGVVYTAIIGLVWGLIATFIVKWWSSNNKRNPI